MSITLGRCVCNNIEMGSYANQSTVTNPFTKRRVGIDNCILSDIKLLWGYGIETIESCCGHGERLGYIATPTKYHKQMEGFGFQRVNKYHGDLWLWPSIPFLNYFKPAREIVLSCLNGQPKSTLDKYKSGKMDHKLAVRSVAITLQVSLDKCRGESA